MTDQELHEIMLQAKREGRSEYLIMKARVGYHLRGRAVYESTPWCCDCRNKIEFDVKGVRKLGCDVIGIAIDENAYLDRYGTCEKGKWI